VDEEGAGRKFDLRLVVGNHARVRDAELASDQHDVAHQWEKAGVRKDLDASGSVIQMHALLHETGNS